MERKKKLYNELLFKIYSRYASYFAPFKETSYSKNITQDLLAKDILYNVLLRECLVYHPEWDRENLYFLYEGEIFKATTDVKRVIANVLSMLGLKRSRSYINDVYFHIQIRTELKQHIVEILKKYIVFGGNYIFDRERGEILKRNYRNLKYFYNLMDDFLRHNEYLENAMSTLDKLVEDGKIDENEDLMLYAETEQLWNKVISLIPFPVRVPTEYNPNAKAERWEQFLKEVVDEKYITVLKRYVGYAFFPDLPFHKVLVLVGEGSNGKSTFLGVIEHVLGEDNVAHVAVQQLGSRFAPAMLENKLLNIYPDLPDRAFKDTGVFKAITGGDKITLEKKYRDPYSAKITTKHIFSANLLPGTKDKTYAFYRRWLIVNFPNQFIDNADPELPEKLKSEASGILNWILEGYKELKEEGDFGYEHNIEEIIEMYELAADSLHQFVANYCREGGHDDIITKDDFYMKYKSYCAEHNLSPRSKVYVSKHLKEYIHTAEADVVRVYGNVKRVWRGVICEY